jgi:hypothetical protein
VKRLKYLLIVLALLSLKSDNLIIWQKTYDFPFYSTWVNKIVPYHENGYVFIGNAENNNDHPGIAARIDNVGNLVWYKVYEDHHLDNLMLAKDGDFLISGDKTGIPVILKINSNGEKKWEKEFTSIDNRVLDNHACTGGFYVQELSNGDFIAAITSIPSCTYIPAYEFISYIFKTNSSGDVIWDTSYVDKSKTIINCIGAGFNNDFILCDSKNDTLRLTKFDSSGKKTWSKIYYASLFFYGGQLLKTNDDSFLVGGVAEDSTKNASNRDIAILKINDNGNVIWYKKYDAGESEILYQLKQFQDKNLAMIAESNYKIYAAELNSNGEIKWNQKFDVFSKNGADIIETSDGCLLVAGMNAFKSWIAKTDTIRDPIYYVAKSSKITEMNYANPISGIPDPDQLENKITGYPNPFDTYLYLETNCLNSSYSIYDLSGRKLKSGLLNGPNTMLNTAEFIKGVYLARISTGTKDTVLKVVKQ